MFAFSKDEAAAERIELVPMEADGVTRESILESMSNFKLEDAHCYDPNEEIKLRSVMADVGEEKFVARIRALADRIRAKDEAEAARGEGGAGRTLVRRITSMGRSMKRVGSFNTSGPQ